MCFSTRSAVHTPRCHLLVLTSVENIGNATAQFIGLICFPPVPLREALVSKPTTPIAAWGTSPMESPLNTPNITQIVQRFARACKLRTIEFFAEEGEYPTEGDDSQNQEQQQQQQQQPAEDDEATQLEAMEALVSNLFANISAFKAAYVQLQTAHTPFDVDNIQKADRAVIMQLQKLSDLKHSFKCNNKRPPPDARLQAQVQERQSMLRTYEMMLNKLEAEIHSKDTEAEMLRQQIQRINERNEKLERRLQKLSGNANVCLTTQMFVGALQEATEEAFSFTKLLVNLMKAAHWDLDAATDSVEPGIRYAKRAHKIYAFQSYVCHGMFGGFENENFYIDGSLSSILDPAKHRLECFNEFQEMRSLDPYEVLGSHPDCLFGKFCSKKYLQIVHPKMENSFFGTLDQRNRIVNGEHPRTHFYGAFLNLAKSIWLLHRLAFSFDPTINIFQVRRGTDFSVVYMENVVHGVALDDDSVDAKPRVGFTVVPGFQVGKTIIQCQVYLTDMKCIE